MPPLEYHPTETPEPVLNHHTKRLHEQLTEGVTDPIERERIILQWREERERERRRNRRRDYTPEQRAAENQRRREQQQARKIEGQRVVSWNVAKKSRFNRAAYNASQREKRHKARLKALRATWRKLHPGVSFAPRHNLDWTQKETDQLRIYYGIADDQKLAKRLGRTVEAIREHAHDIGLDKRDNFLTATDVARILGVHPQRVVKHMQSGDFQGAFNGRMWKVNVLSLIDYIQRTSWMFDVRSVNTDHIIGNAVKNAIGNDPWLTVADLIAQYPYDFHTYDDWIRTGLLPSQKRVGKGCMGYIYVVRQSAAHRFFVEHDRRLDEVKGERTARLLQMKDGMRDDRTDLARSVRKPIGKGTIRVGDRVCVPYGAVINGQLSEGLFGTVRRLYVGVLKRNGKAYKALPYEVRRRLPRGKWIWRAEVEADRRRTDREHQTQPVMLRVLLKDCFHLELHSAPDADQRPTESPHTSPGG